VGIMDKARIIGQRLSTKEIELKLAMLNATAAQSPLLIKLSVILGLMVFTVAASLVITRLNIQYGLLLATVPFVIILVLWVQEKLYMVPCIILFSAAFVPIGFSTGTGSKLVISLVLSLGLLVLWLLRRMLVERSFDFVKTPLYIPVIGFSVTTVVSLVWSIIFRDPLVYIPSAFIFVQLASASIMIVSPALLLALANLVREVKYLKWMVWIMLSLGVLGIFRNFSGIELPANTAGLASMWIVGLSLALALFDEKLPKWARIFCITLAGAWVFWDFVINISWIAGWLPGFVTGSVILLLRSKRMLLLVSLILAVYVLTNSSVFQAWLGDETVTSGDTRMMAWETNWRYTKEHLLFGMGPAGYAVYYMTFNPLEAMATHNNYIDLISQTGLVGSAFFLAIFGLLLWRGWVVTRRLKGRRDFLEALAVTALGGTCGCLVIMAFGDWLLPFAYTQTIAGFSYSVYNWLFMGTILSLDGITGVQKGAAR